MDKVISKMREAAAKSRGYASYWEWAPDRRLAELGIVDVLAEYLTHSEGFSRASVELIENDPPDVLLLSDSGHRIGVEVTELVDEAAAAWHRHQKKFGTPNSSYWADWTADKLASAISQRLERKDLKLAGHTGLYDEIFVAIATDEPNITLELAQDAVQKISGNFKTIQRAFLILSYHPAVDKRLFPQGKAVLSVPLQHTVRTADPGSSPG